MAEIPLPTQSYKDQSQDNINSRLINCYAVPAPQGAISPFTVENCAGLKPFANVGLGPIRGAQTLLGEWYIASGGAIFKLNALGEAIEWGAIPIGGLVPMAAGFSYIIALDGAGNAYLIDGDGVALVDNLPYPASDVVFYDGYFVFSRVDTGEIFVNKITPDVGEKISFDPLDFQTAEVDSDNAVGVLENKANLWVFGQRSVEIYSNVSGFPFSPLKGRYFNVGCASRDTIREAKQQVFWLGNDGVVYNTGQRISDLSVERAIKNSPNIEESYSYAFKELGREFVAFNFVNSTWVYDVDVGLWHERATYQRDTWQPNIAFRAFGKEYVGDSLTNAVYELDIDTYTYDNDIRLVVMQTGYVYIDNRSISLSFLDVFMRVGVGNNISQNPKIMLEYSKDGGRSWSDVVTRDLGKVGKYETQVRFNRLGRSDRYIFRLSVSDAVPVEFVKLETDAKVGRST